jgi:hypothetical protein
MKNGIKFLTLLLAAITLSALMAHLMELPAKINLSRQDYQLVQGIYNGWAWLGIAEIGALVLTFIWLIMERKRKYTFLLVALGCFTVSLIIFFAFTFPTNQTTANWTHLPSDWEALRKQWEYSHAIRALLSFSGFSFLIVTLLEKSNRHAD